MEIIVETSQKARSRPTILSSYTIPGHITQRILLSYYRDSLSAMFIAVLVNI